MVPNAGDSLSGGPSQGLLGSFVIPCFREEASVRRTLTKLDALARSKPDLDWEIIVVDDGSDDATADEAADAGAVVTAPVRLLRHRRNAGLGAAMRTGIQSSRGDVVVAVDCDLSYGIDDIERLIDTWLVCHPHIVIASERSVPLAGGHGGGDGSSDHRRDPRRPCFLVRSEKPWVQARVRPSRPCPARARR